MTELFDLLMQPFQFEFMRHAFIISILVSIPAALLSCFLVLKGWSLMGDAISHAALPGVVLAYVLAIPLAIGAFVAGIFCAIATGYITEHSRVKEDTVMGVVFSGMFGLGIVMITKTETDVHLDHILFGDMLGISLGDIVETGLIALVIAAFIALRWRDLLLYVFDPQHASAIGLPVKFLHYGLLAVISLKCRRSTEGRWHYPRHRIACRTWRYRLPDYTANRTNALMGLCLVGRFSILWRIPVLLYRQRPRADHRFIDDGFVHFGIFLFAKR